MAHDAYSFADDLPASRFKRRLKRLQKLEEGSAKARPGARGGRTSGSSGAALRHPRRKKGQTYAA